MPKSTQKISKKKKQEVQLLSKAHKLPKKDLKKDINAKSAHKAVKKQDKDAENVLCKQDLIIISQGPFRKYRNKH